MYLCLREKGIVKQLKPNSDGTIPEGNNCCVEGKSISHPTLVAHQADAILEVCHV